MKKNRLTIFIIIAMILGIGVGYLVHENGSVGTIKKFSDNIKLLTTIFLRLVQMIIAPLVFCTLVVGIAKLGDLKSVGRVGGKALLWFISASLVSLLLGMLLVGLTLVLLALCLCRMVLLFALLLLFRVGSSSDSEKQRQDGCAGDSNHFHKVLPPLLLR